MEINVLIMLYTLTNDFVSAKYNNIVLYNIEPKLYFLFIRRFVTVRKIYFVAFSFTYGIDCFCLEKNKTELYKYTSL